MGIENYRTTPANNGTVLSSGTLVEGMPPSQINDSVRTVLSDLREFYNDPFFIEYGTGDGATTYTRVNGTQFTIPANVIDTYHVGRRVKLKDGTATILYGTITASAFSSPNTTITLSLDGSASIGSGTITSVKIGLQAINSPAPTNIQTGGIIMWSASAIPDTWLLCNGSLVSKTTYSALWNLIGSTYGTATSTSFYLPNLVEKFAMGKGNSDNLGDQGGSFTQTPTGSNSAPTFTGDAFTPSGSVSISGSTGSHSLTTAEIPEHYHYVVHNNYFTTNSVNNWSAAQMEYAMSRGSAGGMGSSDTHNQTVNTPSLLANGGRSSVVGSGSGHNHSLSASGSFSGSSITPSGSINTPTFTGSVMNIKNPYLALNYIIKA
tara:strand:+ start:493 stop:1623 length:1131 start_codon:yes stop_codon:yes gene_type:complete